ncbi:MAG: DUF5320 domain-containing protein [Candidatus Omnitrophota bacterium]
MPGGDGTGPMGMGPRTGWGRGFCARPAGGSRGVGHIGGRGGFGWRNQFYATGLTGWQRTYPIQPGISEKEESELLKKQATYLSGELEAVRSRLTKLQGAEKQKKGK